MGAPFKLYAESSSCFTVDDLLSSGLHTLVICVFSKRW